MLIETIILYDVGIYTITGLMSLTEIFFDARRKGILTVAINGTRKIQESIRKFGILNDQSNDAIDLR